MQAISDFFGNTNNVQMAVNGVVILIGAIVAIVSFALLLPLDSVNAVSGVVIITAVSYMLSFVAWMIVLAFYRNDVSPEPGSGSRLIWLLTHMMFLIVLPATISATAMNVTTVQNTRNIISGKTA